MDCSSPESVLSSLLTSLPLSHLAWRTSFPYPQNLLRNLAKSGCQTAYTYIPDIDMVPAYGLDKKLEEFLPWLFHQFSSVKSAPMSFPLMR